MKIKNFLSLSFLSLSALFLAGCGKEAPVSYEINLEVWGVFDDSDAYSEIFSDYRKINPFVRGITYRKLSEQTYKEDILNALASGKGPDIFMIRNTWVDSFQDKTVPVSPNMIPEKTFRDALVDVAAEDFITKDGQIYGIPLSVDSLALYYNKDLLNAAGITNPPTTWEELQALVPRLTRIDQFGNITQSALALGTAYNVNRSTDVLMALDYQYGGSPDGEGGYTDKNMINALDFYTQFARSGSPLYTWNPRQHFSIDAFYEGTTAMMLNYSWHYQTIKQKNAKFNFGVAPLPQFANTKPVNFANYWGFAVAKNKTQEEIRPGEKSSIPAAQFQDVRVRESWQLLKYMALPHPNKAFTVQNSISGTTMDFAVPNDPTERYLQKTGKPAARRDLLEPQKADVKLSPFALGNLLARSWKPINTEAVETILADGIDAVNKGERTINDAVATIANRISQFKRR